MLKSWRFGSAFGIDLYVHWTFWFLPLIVLLTTAQEAGWTEGFLSLSVILTLFACVLLHELGHALAARRYGIPTLDITLYPIGGIARLKQISERPSEELVIALAGPAVNVVIAVLLGCGMVLAGVPFSLSQDTYPLGQMFLNRVLWLNVALVVFNMLPAFPMDGGRVLRAILAMFMKRLTATKLAFGVGTVVLAGFVLVGVGLPLWLDQPVSPLLPVVGVLLYLIGRQELRSVERLERQRENEAKMLARQGPITQEELDDPFLRPNTPDFTGVTYSPYRKVWIHWQHGVPVRVSVWRED